MVVVLGLALGLVRWGGKTGWGICLDMEKTAEGEGMRVRGIGGEGGGV